MTRPDAMEWLMHAGCPGSLAVDHAWGLCDALDKVDNVHLYNVGVEELIFLVHGPIGWGWASPNLVATAATNARATIDHETEVRLQPGH